MIRKQIRRVIHGWRGSWIWEWRYVLKCKTLNVDFCHVGLEAGTYKGTYVELTVVILGAGFYVEWYDRLTRSVFSAEMEQTMAEVKSQLENEGSEHEDDE